MTLTLDQLTGNDGIRRITDQTAEIRADKTETGTRTITGIGVAYGEEFDSWGFRERFEPGAIEDDSQALACYRHGNPIGRLTSSRDTEGGREVTLQLSSTPTADEAHTLARDGVIRGLSIGFVPVEWREEHTEDDDRPLIVHTKVQVREYSLVPWPAYQSAQISSVRSAPAHTEPRPAKETPPKTETDVLTRADLDAVSTDLTERMEDIKRQFATLEAPADTTELEQRAAQFEDFGSWVQAIAVERSAGHAEAVALYRDITTSDIPSKLVNTPGFIGDLTKRLTERRRWTNKFRSRRLPEKGMTVDYIKTHITATVAEQVNQLDALAKGSGFSVTTDSSPVRTFGGAETVSRQVIDRSEPWALTGLFEAFALQYGRETEAATKAYIVDAIEERATSGAEDATIAVPADFGALDWIDAIVDSAGIFEDRGYDLQELTVSKDVFKRLAAETGTDGRPLLTVAGSGMNVVGQLDLPKASGDLMRVPVTVLYGADPQTALFYDPIAIETLEKPGAPFWLQEDNVLNLSRDYAAYGYMAHITPHPDALLPVDFGVTGG